MARKVFISFLGTGFYQPCSYTKGDFRSKDVCYIQEATLDYLNSVEPWSSNDICYILLTKDAEAVHWGSTKLNLKTGESFPNDGLSIRLRQMGLPFTIKPIKNLPSSGNENDIWEIFNVLFNLLEDGDQLYLDITHAFRYLPMLMLVFSNYAKFLKNITIQSVTYGNWEAHIEQEVDGYTRLVAPIVDLLPLVALQDWTYAAGQYIDGGNSKSLCFLGKQELMPILRNAKGENTSASSLSRFLMNLYEFSNNTRLCRGKVIISSEHVAKIRAAYKGITTSIIPPLHPVLSKVVEDISEFNSTSTIKNCFAAVNWCLKYELIQQAATILEEAVVSTICNQEGLDYGEEAERDCITCAINILFNKISEDEWQLDPNGKLDGEQLARKKLKVTKALNNTLLNLVCSDYNSLKGLRNDINHSGMRNNPMSISKLTSKIRELTSKIESCILDNGHNNTHSEITQNIFVNFSNHHSSNWSEQQLRAALELGDIIDLQFPAINENDDENYIVSTAEEYIHKICNLASNPSSTTIHIMGEMTFTYAMVNALKNAGYTCVASTTQRIVETLPNGEKNVKFEFARFRKYE